MSKTTAERISFRMRTVPNVVDVLDRTPFAALSRSVEDLNHDGNGAHTKKMRSRRRLSRSHPDANSLYSLCDVSRDVAQTVRFIAGDVTCNFSRVLDGAISNFCDIACNVA